MHSSLSSSKTKSVHPPAELYHSIRQQSEQICAPLQLEDYGVQAMPDTSPPKWHLAHTSWFFETMLLQAYLNGYRSFHPKFGYLFNSYYEGVGPMYARPKRGVLSRPTTDEIYQYRAYIDQAMDLLMQTPLTSEQSFRLLLGLAHEQQHQELLLTDIKFNFFHNPIAPAFQTNDLCPSSATEPQHRWLPYEGGLIQIGHEGHEFSFDNEQPRHPHFLQPFALGSRLVTNAEYLQFMQEDGYQRAEFWLSEGWQLRHQRQWQAPLYWQQLEGNWSEFNLTGSAAINWHAPVRHISFHEAYAFSRWKGARLPTEAEWEHAATHTRTPSLPASDPEQIFGQLWQWTQSPYVAYPGYAPFSGQLAEYNGKFMSNQMVLRGGSCATPAGHLRPTYRNFFYASDRWQFSGIRLAKNL